MKFNYKKQKEMKNNVTAANTAEMENGNYKIVLTDGRTQKETKTRVYPYWYGVTLEQMRYIAIGMRSATHLKNPVINIYEVIDGKTETGRIIATM